jgi:hypothetical protein
MVIRNSYVDDILQSDDNVEEARRIAQETEIMLAFGGFSIKHWNISGTETGYKGIVNTNTKLAGVVCIEQVLCVLPFLSLLIFWRFLDLSCL